MYQKSETDSIKRMFDSIAKRYDRANSIMSLNMHKKWNRKLVKGLQSPKRYLDLCSGTGEIAFTLLKDTPEHIETFMLDFSQEMLDVAKKKAESLNLKQHTIQYLQADAQKIPLPRESIDCASMAYGIRNVQDPSLCAQEVYRVLRPGGTFAILELTQPKNPLMKLGHTFYLRTILPLVGRCIASDKNAYKYLCQSIQSFISPEKLEKVLKEAGFSETSHQSLSGGIATIWLAKK